MGDQKNAQKVLVGNRPLGSYMCRWWNNIKMDLIAWTGLN
jgi:hypothetical protein